MQRLRNRILYLLLQAINKIREFKLGSLNILRVVMESQPPDILAINELDASIPDFLIRLPGYCLVRLKRNRSGGGVCVCVRSSMHFRCGDLENDLLELLALEIKKNKPNSKPFWVHCYYRSPHSPI